MTRFFKDAAVFTVKVENVEEFKEVMELMNSYNEITLEGVEKVEYFPYGKDVKAVGKDTGTGFKTRAIIEGQKYVFFSHADMLKTVYKTIGYDKLEAEFARETKVDGKKIRINYIYKEDSFLYDVLKNHHSHTEIDDGVIGFLNLDAKGKEERSKYLCDKYNIDFKICNSDWGEYEEVKQTNLHI